MALDTLKRARPGAASSDTAADSEDEAEYVSFLSYVLLLYMLQLD